MAFGCAQGGSLAFREKMMSFHEAKGHTTMPPSQHDLDLLTDLFVTYLKNKLSENYLSLRENEKKHTPHSQKHNTIVQQLHIITEDIKKLQEEISITETSDEEIIASIKKDLSLKNKE